MDDGMPTDFDGGGMPSFNDVEQEPQLDGPTDGGIDMSGGNMEGGIQEPENGQSENGFGPEPDNDSGSEEENYGNDFDAGVGADENEDPEKYLQQLTGKLCAKLKKYNDEKPEPDAGMCKYIAGMVLAQCTKGLDEKEKDEILSKLTKSDDGEDTDNEQDKSNNENDFDAEVPEQTNDSLNEERKIVERIVQNMKNDFTDKKPKGISNKRKSYRMTPYMTPEFK